VILRGGLSQAPVRDLSVEDPIADDFKLPHEGARILAEVMENLDDASVLENLFEAQLEGVHLEQVKDIAGPVKSDLIAVRHQSIPG
jgi:hypothetical protein